MQTHRPHKIKDTAQLYMHPSEGQIAFYGDNVAVQHVEIQAKTKRHVPFYRF